MPIIVFSQVHVHLMQKLQVPLHIMFTMPWTPTKDYMHPLAPMQSMLNNKQSYTVVERMVSLDTIIILYVEKNDSAHLILQDLGRFGEPSKQIQDQRAGLGTHQKGCTTRSKTSSAHSVLHEPSLGTQTISEFAGDTDDGARVMMDDCLII